jgi:hypothetical protein
VQLRPGHRSVWGTRGAHVRGAGVICRSVRSVRRPGFWRTVVSGCHPLRPGFWRTVVSRSHRDHGSGEPETTVLENHHGRYHAAPVAPLRCAPAPQKPSQQHARGKHDTSRLPSSPRAPVAGDHPRVTSSPHLAVPSRRPDSPRRPGRLPRSTPWSASLGDGRPRVDPVGSQRPSRGCRPRARPRAPQDRAQRFQLLQARQVLSTSIQQLSSSARGVEVAGSIEY